ncbi:hypothetical protein Dimus_011027 [Dionaea muscipula]
MEEGQQEDFVMEEEYHEEVVDGNPKDDSQEGASRDETVIKEATDPKADFVEEVLREIVVGKEVDLDDDPKNGNSPVEQAPPKTSTVHGHIEQAVKCILDGMAKQSKGITALSEHLDSKIFTDNQKEKLMWVRFKEIKTYLTNFSTELNNLSISLKKTMFQVANLISDKIKNQSTLMELKVEESEMNLKHLVEKKFLKNDIRRKGIEDTVKDISKSQALLTESLLTFIEDAKTGEDSGGEQKGQGSKVCGSGSYKEES